MFKKICIGVGVVVLAAIAITSIKRVSSACKECRATANYMKSHA